MGACEGKAVELRDCFPSAGRVAGRFGSVSFQQDPITRDGVADAEEGSVSQNSKLIAQVRSVLTFPIRKLPQVSIDRPFGPLPDEEPPLLLSHKSHEPAFRGRRARRAHGEFSHAIFAQRKTKLARRANRTPRLAGRANECAQLH